MTGQGKPQETQAVEGPPGLEIVLDEDTAAGIYANLAIIGHGETEFILDFLFVHPQQKKCKVLSRIITSPAHAKRLVAAFQDNIRRYEQRFGPIPMPQGPAMSPQVGQA